MYGLIDMVENVGINGKIFAERLIENLMKNIFDMSSEIIGFLDKIKKEDKLVLVEGLKDKKVLQDFAIKRVKTLEKRALYKVVEEIKDKVVVMLVDLDKEGKKLYGRRS